jgi:hypothetical protein
VLRAVLLVSVILLAGCPRDVGMPAPSEDARPCTTVADCNDGRTCGELSACVDGLCEDGTSLEIPCP